MYEDQELTADDVGAKLCLSHPTVVRAAHEHGVPVRADTAAPHRSTITLVEALYGDPQVMQTP